MCAGSYRARGVARGTWRGARRQGGIGRSLNGGLVDTAGLRAGLRSCLRVECAPATHCIPRGPCIFPRSLAGLCTSRRSAASKSTSASQTPPTLAKTWLCVYFWPSVHVPSSSRGPLSPRSRVALIPIEYRTYSVAGRPHDIAAMIVDISCFLCPPSAVPGPRCIDSVTTRPSARPALLQYRTRG